MILAPAALKILGMRQHSSGFRLAGTTILSFKTAKHPKYRDFCAIGCFFGAGILSYVKTKNARGCTHKCAHLCGNLCILGVWGSAPVALSIVIGNIFAGAENQARTAEEALCVINACAFAAFLLIFITSYIRTLITDTRKKD